MRSIMVKENGDTLELVLGSQGNTEITMKFHKLRYLIVLLRLIILILLMILITSQMIFFTFNNVIRIILNQAEPNFPVLIGYGLILLLFVSPGIFVLLESILKNFKKVITKRSDRIEIKPSVLLINNSAINQGDPSSKFTLTHKRDDIFIISILSHGQKIELFQRHTHKKIPNSKTECKFLGILNVELSKIKER